MAKKQSNTVRAEGSGQIFIVGPRGDGWTFRSSTSGAFSTKVMSNDAYKAASQKANTAIQEALKHPPKVALAGKASKDK